MFCDEFLRLQLITFEVNGDCEVRDCVGRDLFSDSLMIGDLTRITASNFQMLSSLKSHYKSCSPHRCRGPFEVDSRDLAVVSGREAIGCSTCIVAVA